MMADGSVSSRSRRLAYYGVPMLFCLAVHWLALKMWFYLDDFAWLGLRLEVHSPRDVFWVLFRPEAQGTIRTLSERLFFLVFSSIFGLASPPFRVWVFVTQFANIALLIQIARRLTGSAVAGFLAATFWVANAGLAIALAWTSAYNEIAFAFFVLLAFRLFLLHIDTGERKYWIWQWIVFLLGFGALELNVVYPALTAGFAFVCARQFFRKTLYLFLPALAFTVFHFAFIPRPSDPSYQMHFGQNILSTLWGYWAFATGALRHSPINWRPMWLGRCLAVSITLALVLFLVSRLRRGQWLPVFLFGWFVAVILPVLPLANHFTEYYVTVPTIGLAILGAWAVADARGIAAAVAVALAGLYLVVSVDDIRVAQKYYYERSRKFKHLIRALETLHGADAKKTILVSGVDNETYWLGFYGDPFRLINVSRIYLVPGAEKQIDPHPEWGGISRFVISLDDVVNLVRRHDLIVFAFQGTDVREVTQEYVKQASEQYAAGHPEFVDIGDPLYQSQLGPTWQQIERGSRWMPKTATVRIAGPRKSGQVLEVTGYCPAVLGDGPPVKVLFRADGIDVGNAALKADQRFDLRFPLAQALVGRQTMQIEIETSRTVQVAGDQRPHGMVFGTFAIK